MKNRLKKLENSIPDVDPVQQLGSIYTRFAKAYYVKKDMDLALDIRRLADLILKEHPELRESVPGRIGKNAYIDWSFFIRFPKSKELEAGS